ncbi:hypothetical protein NRF20_45500 [Streptomyces sp. R-74717]|uniref:hypothetical protein n=1 Tax=Streptomyces TaxID=1883 RepID=UPI0037B74C66
MAGDGYVPADDLRDDHAILRGHSAALKRALQRGCMRGLRPAEMKAPIQPDGPGFGKVAGYLMDEDLVQVFFAAIRTTDTAPEAWYEQRTTQREALEKPVCVLGGTWETRRAVTAFLDAGHEVTDERARQLLRDLAAAGFLTKTDPNKRHLPLQRAVRTTTTAQTGRAAASWCVARVTVVLRGGHVLRVVGARRCRCSVGGGRQQPGQFTHVVEHGRAWSFEP